jgi:hypothetical protein
VITWVDSKLFAVHYVYIMFPLNRNIISKVSQCCINTGKRRCFLFNSDSRSLQLLTPSHQQQPRVIVRSHNKLLHPLTKSFSYYTSSISRHSFDRNSDSIKRYVSSKKESSAQKERKQMYRALQKLKTKKNGLFDEEDYIEPTFENGFGYVVARPPRLGYEDGLYGVGSFGCSYDRHELDPKDDNPDVYEIQILIEQRVDCKYVKDFDMADTIEEELQVLHGVYLDDQEKLWTTRPELVTKTRLKLLREQERKNKNEQTS